MILNEMGQIAYDEWLKTAELRPNVQLHNFVVMPNHFHAIVEIVKKCFSCFFLKL
jgi:REP element-mobilizing transposase RayT